MKLSALKIDSRKKREGGWIDTGMDGLWLKVKGLHTRDWSRRYAELVEELPLDRRVDGELSDDDRAEINATLLDELVLLDWRGFTDDDGETQIPFDRERARAMLHDPDYEEFTGAVMAAASIVGRHGKDSYEAAVGNSSARSAGTSAGASTKSGSAKSTRAKSSPTASAASPS